MISETCQRKRGQETRQSWLQPSGSRARQEMDAHLALVNGVLTGLCQGWPKEGIFQAGMLGLGVIGLGQGGHRIRHTGRSVMLVHLGQLLRLKASTSMFAFMA